MSLPLSSALAQVFDEARDISQSISQSTSSLHLLLAFFTVPNAAKVLLLERRIDEDCLLAVVRKGEREDPGVVKELRQHAERIARVSDASMIEPLHMLVAMTRARKTLARTLLGRVDVDMAALRNTAMSYLTGSMPRRMQQASKRTVQKNPLASIKRQRVYQRRRAQPSTLPMPSVAELLDIDPTKQDDRYASKEVKTGSRPRRSNPPGSTARQDNGPASFTPPLGPHASPAESADSLDDQVQSDPAKHNSAQADVRDPGAAKMDPGALAAGALDPQDFPWLTSLGRDLLMAAEQHQLDEVVGRNKEIDFLIDILGKRRANNPVLIGDPGVGKTAIVEGLAVRLHKGLLDKTPLAGRHLIELDMGSIVAGTQLRGSLSERLQGIKDEVRDAAGQVIVFIDEIHTLMGAGAAGDGPQDTANELKTALARGEFPCIGATTIDEYKKHIESDAALERRFVPLQVEEPSFEDSEQVLRGIASVYEQHHHVRYADEAFSAAVQLSSRYITDRFLPGKAVDVIDLAGSRTRRAGRELVDRSAVAEVIAGQSAVPLDRLLLKDGERFLQAERELKKWVVGQDHVVSQVAELIRRGVAGFYSRRPLASMLFVGPSGVGKTELAKGLADFLFASDKALVRVDMSEYGEAHAKSRLIGSPPGYVGHEEGGQLTEAIRRRPHAVILLDEIEKAHPDILTLLLQVLDEGRLTDGRGRTVIFNNTVVVMTSNLGHGRFDEAEKRTLGFSAADSDEAQNSRSQASLKAAEQSMPIELWGRIDAKLVFHTLDRHAVARIVAMLVKESSARLNTERGIDYEIDPDVVDHLIAQGGLSLREGVRPLRRILEREVEGPIAAAILSGQLQRGQHAVIRADAQGLKVVSGRPSQARAGA